MRVYILMMQMLELLLVKGLSEQRSVRHRRPKRLRSSLCSFSLKLVLAQRPGSPSSVSCSVHLKLAVL